MTSPGRSPNPGFSSSLSSSVPRADVTARLASPVPQRPNNPDPTPSDDASGTLTPLAGPGANYTGPGVSALAAALSHSLGTSPPRLGTPPVARTVSPSPEPRPSASSTALAQLAPEGTATPTRYGSFDSRARMGYEDPEIVRRHLVQPSDAASASEKSSLSAANGGSSSALKNKGKQPVAAAAAEESADGEFSSLRLQGGDVTRGIYKWTEEAEARQNNPRRYSFTLMRPEPEDEVLDISSIKVPGGFRRNYIRRAAGSPPADPSRSGGALEAASGPAQPSKLPTSSFLEFLTLYGHFAGEELEEDDEVLGPDEYFSAETHSSDESSGEEHDHEPMEDSMLLPPSRRRRRRKVRGGSGTNSPMNAALLLLKSFVGTGVLFLPRAFLSGGMLFGNLVLLGVSVLSYYCFVLLVSTRLRIEGSFGDIGGILYGRWMRSLILTSIVLSQIGFVAAYTVFTAENLRAFILAVSGCGTVIDVKWLILLQMVIFLPFSLLRDIGKLGFTALVADAFILIGLTYLLYYDVLTLATDGLADIVLFNGNDWTLFIGTAIFTFEGIGLIIPIQESMRRPDKFPRVMAAVMVIITVVFVTIGAVSYAAYGSRTETVVLLNLPQDNKLVNGVQFLYSVAILLSTPLQIFPAIRITENAMFTRSGKFNPYIKWQKNAFRFLFVALCMGIAWGGADSLDKFVALVGNFACIPLVFIYPPLLHFKAVARNRLWKISDVVLTIFGFIAMAYTTSLTIMSWAASPSPPPIPGFCDGDGK